MTTVSYICDHCYVCDDDIIVEWNMAVARRALEEIHQLNFDLLQHIVFSLLWYCYHGYRSDIWLPSIVIHGYHSEYGKLLP